MATAGVVVALCGAVLSIIPILGIVHEDTSGEFDAVLASSRADGPTTMTVQASDGAVEFSGDCVWTRR